MGGGIVTRSLLFFDFETGGLNPDIHGILQAAWIVEKKGEIVAERVMDVHPGDSNLCLAALETNNITLERMKKGMSTHYMLYSLSQDLRAAMQAELFPIPVAYNVNFDLSFLIMEAKTQNIWLDLDLKNSLDPRAYLQWIAFQGKIKLSDYKLKTVCEHFGITLKPHDALEDVRALRTLFHKLETL
jgi:DNA polymerase-3 subunit epsilon